MKAFLSLTLVFHILLFVIINIPYIDYNFGVALSIIYTYNNFPIKALALFKRYVVIHFSYYYFMASLNLFSISFLYGTA